MREVVDPQLQAAQDRHSIVVAEGLAAGEEEAAAAAVTPAARYNGPEASTMVAIGKRRLRSPAEIVAAQAQSVALARQAVGEDGPPEGRE